MRTVQQRRQVTRLNIAHAAGRIGCTAAEYSQHVASGEKWCTKHKRWEPRSAFWKNSSRTDGLATSCAQGMKEYRVYG